MQTVIGRWLEQVRRALPALAERPVVLLLITLGLNALVFPYAGFTHDAMLYAAQVYNRAEAGILSGDLFFHYGSQDEYSLFSLLLTPLVKALGLPWTFFLAYLASKALLCWGLLRVVLALVKDRAVAVGAVLFLTFLPVGHSAFGVFTLNEPFLTARLPACGLVLLGLARLLDGRPAGALVLLGLAMLIHPLMALPGVATALLWLALEYLPRRLFCALAGAVGLALALVLACAPVGHRLFGDMDRAWMDQVWRFNIIIFPLDWSTDDWMHALAAVLVVAGAIAFGRPQRPREWRLAGAAALVGLGGLLVSVAAAEAHYTRILQAQTFRALWLPQFLCIPLGLELARQWWATGKTPLRLLAVVIVQVVMGVCQFLELEFIIYAGALLTALVACRGLAKAPRRPDWLAACLLVTLAAGGAAWALAKLGIVWMYHEDVIRHREAFDVWRIALIAVGPLVWAPAVLAAAVWLARFRPGTRAALALAVWLVGSAAVFLVPTTAYYRANLQGDRADIQFIQHFLEARRGRDHSTPTVYLSTYHLDRVWLDLRANSYFNVYQMAGAIFSEGTTREGARRARLAKAFEVARCRREEKLNPESARHVAKLIFQTVLDSPPPSRADLARLCRDGAVDYVIVPDAFAGLYAATNGRLYIYDCVQVRAALGRAPSSETAALHPRVPSPQRP